MAKRPSKKTTPPVPELKAETVPIDKLTPDPRNARQHDEANIAALMKALARFGQQKPIVRDEKGVVVAGNGILEAAKRLGWKALSAVTTKLTGKERVAFAIADNRMGELSVWHDETLLALLQSLPADVVSDVGFSADDIAKLAGEDGPLQDDEPPAPMPTPVTKRGDLWLLGDHRLLCGDSTKVDDVTHLMNGAKATLCSTDPPYLVDYTGSRPEKSGKDWSAHTKWDASHKDPRKFYFGVFTNALAVLAEHGAIYCWHGHKLTGAIQAVWEKLDILDHQLIVWVKPTSVFGASMWHFRHETCIMGWRRKSKPTHDGRHTDDSVWEDQPSKLADLSKAQLIRIIEEASDVWELNWEGKARVIGNEHPTQKPLELFAKPMRKHTQPNDVVYEPFSGSGSQIVAAEKLHRRCYAMELEPVFVDVAVRRWQAATGKPATHASTGKTWEQTARARKVKPPTKTAA